MNDTLDITVRGHILQPDGTPVACPSCHAETGLTIYGPVGGAGTLMCPNGDHFAVPEPIDAAALLARAAEHPYTEML